MSLGYGVGDFLAVVNLAKAIRVRFVRAPDQFRHISEASKTLCNVLRDIKDIYEQAELDTQQEKHLDEISRSCRSGLNELLSKLDQYQELDPGTNSLGGTCRRVWKRLKWDQAEMAEICQRIQSNVHIFHLFSTSLTSQVAFATNELVHRVNNTMEDKAQHKLLEWLTTVNYATQQEEYLKRRQEGTGKWLLGTDKFQQWIDNENKNILCTGIPGAGKTILTAVVIEYLEEKCKHDRNCGLAYIYCNFRCHHEQSVDDILASLIKQLCQRMSSLPEDIKTLYAQHKKRQTRPKLDELSESLSVLLGHFSRIFIVVDALDEYSSRGEALRRLLSELFRLQSNSTVSIFATSRHSPWIQSAFEGCLQQEVSAATEDVEAYLRGHMSDLSRAVLRDKDLQEEIVKAITKTVDGMFLLAQLHLDSLRGKLSVTAVKKTLEKLPTGTDAYDIAYEEAMERINGKTEGEKELAIQILAWITCAQVPLMIEQLQFGLAVEPDEAKFDPDNLPDTQDMVAVCAGLVTIDEKCRIIRLVHHTAQEYFERSQTKWFPRAHYEMARVCVAYLSSSLRLARAEPGLVLGFLQDTKKLAHCFRQSFTFMTTETVFRLSAILPDSVTKAQLAAYFGFDSALKELIEAGHCFNALDAANRSPLSWAADNGHEAATRGLFLDHQDRWGFTPLALAATNGYCKVVSLLLSNGVSPDLKSNDGRTPLMLACEQRPGRVSRPLRMLIGIKKIIEGHLELRSSTFYSYKRVVELLLEADCDPNSKDERGRTALHLAAGILDTEIIKLLLAKGADPLSTDNAGQTPLFYAAGHGNAMGVRLLLEQGVNPNHLSDIGTTPLLLACKWQATDVVRDLLDCGADPSLADHRIGRTPLVWAAAKGCDSMVETLLRRGIDVDSQGRDGWTALLAAIVFAHRTTVRKLVKHGADPNLPGPRHGRTPLWWAARMGDEIILKQILESGGDPDAADKQGTTPLMKAASAGYANIVRLLLGTGNVNPERRNKRGDDATTKARCRGHDRIALLLEVNMDIKETLKVKDIPAERADARLCTNCGLRGQFQDFPRCQHCLHATKVRSVFCSTCDDFLTVYCASPIHRNGALKSKISYARARKVI
ncbi:ankyrin repeat-containing protein [Aspergillus luchuensis IFO 4308]|nr:ankyrin repeat-containing protein [Aspergillus luchuensis IFO 4308]